MNLKKIADGLRLIADGLDDTAQEETTKPARDTKPRKTAPKTKEKEQAEAPEPEAKTKEPDTTTSSKAPAVEDVIKVMQQVAKVNGRAGIDAILADFNVGRVSELDASDYADVITVAKTKLGD